MIDLALSAVLAVAAPCRPPASVPPPGSAQEAFLDLVAAFNARDLPRAMARMADDVVLTHPRRGDPTRADIEAGFRARWASRPRATIEVAVEEICESGPLAVVRVTWRATYPEQGGGVTVTGERDVETWTNEDGRWRLKRGLSFPIEPRLPPGPSPSPSPSH